MKKIYLIIIFFIPISVNAQTGTLRNIKTDDFDIFIARETMVYDTVNSRTITYPGLSVLQDVNYINNIKDSTVALLLDDSAYEVNINKIKSLKFYSGSEVHKGLLYGSLAGFTFGTVTTSILMLITSSARNGEIWITPIIGVICAVPGAIIGGIIGSTISKSYKYDFSNMTFDRKKSEFIRLIRKYR